MSKPLAGFVCKCCHRDQSVNQQVNRSGYCIQCYGHCVLAEKNRCDVLKTDTKYKTYDEDFVILDEAAEMSDAMWLKMKAAQELKSRQQE